MTAMKDLHSMESYITSLQQDLRKEKGNYSELMEQNDSLQQNNEYLSRSYHQLEEVRSFFPRTL
jgi:regulator of replication initiation timing